MKRNITISLIYRKFSYPFESVLTFTLVVKVHDKHLQVFTVFDEMALFGDTDEGSVLARLRAFGVSDGALKRGAAGPMDLGPEHATITVSPVSQVMDTTAAGDSFNAAYLAARIIGLDAKSSLLAGHELAAQVICQRGAIVECTRPSVLG